MAALNLSIENLERGRMVAEIRVKIKDGEGRKTTTEPILVYDEFTISQNDSILKKIVEEVKSQIILKDDPEISLNIKLDWNS